MLAPGHCITLHASCYTERCARRLDAPHPAAGAFISADIPLAARTISCDAGGMPLVTKTRTVVVGRYEIREADEIAAATGGCVRSPFGITLGHTSHCPAHIHETSVEVVMERRYCGAVISTSQRSVRG